MKKILALGIVAAMALAGAAYAYPTLTGATGLAALPTAAVAPAGQLDLAADFYNTKTGAVKDAFPVRVQYGVAENFEVGAAFLMQKDMDRWYANVKYGTPLTLAGFGFAVGAQYGQMTDAPKAKTTQLYVAGTRAFGGEADGVMPALNGTLGVNWTQFKVAGASFDAFRAFAGLDAAFANNLNVAAEVQTMNKKDLGDVKALSSLVVRYPLTEALTGQVGVTNALDLNGAKDYNVFAGVNYVFGLGE